MIHRIEVQAFKSLLDVAVDLGRVNVFVGANGAGKSNLLEAIGVLGAAAAGRVDDEALRRRGVRPGVPALYKSSFRGSRARAAIGLSAHGEGEATYQVELHNPLKDPHPAWSFSTERLQVGTSRLVGRSPRSQAQLDPQRGLASLRAVEFPPGTPQSALLDRLSRYAIYGPDTATLRGLRSDQQQREPVGLAGGRLPEAVGELLRRARSDNRLAEIAASLSELIDWSAGYKTRAAGKDLPLSPSVASPQQVLQFKDRFMARDRDTLTSYDASEGALYVLFAAALAALPGAPPLLAINNLDHGLHPRLARALMSRLSRWILSAPDQRQLLVTSHNPLLLDGLPLDDDDVRLFAVGRSRKGRTTVRRVHVELGDLQRDGEIWTVSRLWVTGSLGGVPDV